MAELWVMRLKARWPSGHTGCTHCYCLCTHSIATTCSCCVVMRPLVSVLQIQEKSGKAINKGPYYNEDPLGNR